MMGLEKQGGIRKISVRGFKSIFDKQTIEITPLTLLAGANSSGKSSMMQPMLLLKQTLESVFDPGPLLLDGPNVRLSNAREVLSSFKQPQGERQQRPESSFSVGVESLSTEDDRFVSIYVTYKLRQKLYGGFEISRQEYSVGNSTYSLWPSISINDFAAQDARLEFLRDSKTYLKVFRDRCFLSYRLRIRPPDDVEEKREELMKLVDRLDELPFEFTYPRYDAIEQGIRGMIHLPGFRGNPVRDYPVAGIGEFYPGTFEHYVAGVLQNWRSTQEGKSKLAALNKDLELLDLTSRIMPKRISDTRSRIDVERKKHAGFVSIADVGFGLSQVLPVLVALHVAKPGQLVFVEQPEMHLHPKAQLLLAKVLTQAAKRGVRVVAETHSSLLLLGVQTEIAEQRIDRNLVRFHWFSLSPDGKTEVHSASPNEFGAVGDWPQDFGTTELEAQKKYLDVSERRMREGNVS